MLINIYKNRDTMNVTTLDKQTQEKYAASYMKIKEQKKRFYERNKEKIIEYGKQYYQKKKLENANLPEEIKSYNKTYYQRNKATILAKQKIQKKAKRDALKAEKQKNEPLVVKEDETKKDSTSRIVADASA